MMTVRKLQMSSELTFPATDAVTQTLVVYGGKGMGKTNFGAVLCEELAAAGKRFCFIDPIGVAWGLRHSADGKGEGIKLLILGGRHGDLPIEPTGGAVVAEFLAESTENVLIDVSSRADGTRWTVTDKIKFVTAFVTRLLERYRRAMPPLMLVLDEAARFAPQQVVRGSAGADSLTALEVLVEEGRNSGIGITLLTQRSARMAKSVSELAEAMIAFRIIGPNSVDAVLDWFGEHVHKSKWDQLVDQLRKLPRGQALVVSPGWLEYEGIASIRLRHTFDSSKTPTGTEQKLAKRAKPADLEQLRTRIAATVEKAEAADPVKVRAKLESQHRDTTKRADELARQVQAVTGQLEQAKARLAAKAETADRSAAKSANTELKAELVKYRRALEAAMKILVKVQAIDFDVESEEDRKVLEQAVAAAVKQVTQPIEKRVTALKARVDGHKRAAEDAATEIQKLLSAKIDLTVHVTQREPFDVKVVPTRPTPVRPPKTTIERPDGFVITGPMQRILNALAWGETVRLFALKKTQLAFLADASPSSSSFVNNLGALRSGGLIHYPQGGVVALTAAGRVDAHVSGELPSTSAELQQAICAKLPAAQARIVVALVNAHPDALDKDQLAERAGASATSSSYVNNLGALRSLGVIEYPSKGFVSAAAVLFLDI